MADFAANFVDRDAMVRRGRAMTMTDRRSSLRPRDPRTSSARWPPGRCRWILRRFSPWWRSPYFLWRLAVEPPCAETCAIGDRDSIFSTRSRALHELVTSFSGLRWAFTGAAWIGLPAGSICAC